MTFKAWFYPSRKHSSPSCMIRVFFFQPDNFVFPLLTLIAWKGTFSSERVFGGGEGRVVFVTEHTCDDGKLTLK